MRNDEPSYRDKGRAVFLAAIMVLSVVAMSVALSGAGAAVDANVDSVAIDNIDVDSNIIGADDETYTIEFSADSEEGGVDDVAFVSVAIDEVDLSDVEDDDVSVSGITEATDDVVIAEDDRLVVAIGSQSIESNDEPVIEITGLENPAEAGEYELTLGLHASDAADNGAGGPVTDGDGVIDDTDQFEIISDDPELEYVNVNGDGINVIFQGQDVYAVGNSINAAGEQEYDLRSVGNFDNNRVESSTFVEQLESEEVADIFDGDAPDAFDDFTWAVEIETDDLDADDYFLRGGLLDRNPAEDDTFETVIQDLTAEFDDNNVTDEGPDSETELETDSTRGTYQTNVSADGDLEDFELFDIALSSGDLEEIAEELDLDSDASAEEVVDELRGDDIVYETDRAGNPQLVDGAGDVGGETTFGNFSVALWDEGESDADEKVVFISNGDVDSDVYFDGIDDSTYDFHFNVTDTEASDNATISVAESDASANFDQDVYTQTAGDLQHFEIELEDTDEAYIQFGDEDAGFIDILYIEDDNDSGTVNFTVNTRLWGTSDDGGIGDEGLQPERIVDRPLENDRVFYSEDDIVESYIHTGEAFQEGAQPTFFDDDDFDEGDEYQVPDTNLDRTEFSQYLEDLDLISSNAADRENSGLDQLVRPLQPTDYDITVDENGHFAADGDESSVDDEIGFATLELIAPELGDINTWVGPSEDADDEDEIAELVGQLTERDTVAIEDLLVVQIEASGIYGHMVDIDDNGFEAITDNDGFSASTLEELDGTDGEGVEFIFEDEDPIGNQDENALDFDADDDEVFVLVDNENGQLFIAIDTDAQPFTERDVADGDEFTIELTYEVEDDRFRFGDTERFDNRFFLGGGDGDRHDDAFPYLRSGSISTNASVTFEDAAVTWDNVDDDGNVELEIADDSTISGETNIAPGSDVTQRVRHAGNTSSFLNNVDTEIDSDGSFEGTTDFSDRDVDDEARITFRLSGSTVDTGDGIFVEAVGVEDDDDADDVEVDDVEVDDDVEMDDEVEEPTDDDDEQPGFGVAVALVALLAAAMLALRRRD